MTWRRVVLAAAALCAAAAPSWSQSLTANPVGDVLHVRIQGLIIIEGQTLERLKDGRSVRLDVELSVLARPRGRVVAESRESFNVSLDLWEERYAVTRLGAGGPSISHLKPRDAEMWCFEHLAVPVSALGTLGRDAPFWLRLEYQVDDTGTTAESEPSERFTLGGLIDVFSRRRQNDALKGSIEAGPFRLQN